MILDAIFPDLSNGSWLSIIAIACIGAAIGSLILTVLALWRQRGQALRLSDALVLRDRLIKNLILASLSEEDQDRARVPINEAFTKANALWISEFVEPAFGKDEAARITRRLAGQSA